MIDVVSPERRCHRKGPGGSVCFGRIPSGSPECSRCGGDAATSLDDYANQPDLPTGWAIRIKGLISIRTASYRPEAAMINSLVLHGNVPSWSTGTWTDDRIRREFDTLAPGLGLELVEVECVERGGA